MMMHRGNGFTRCTHEQRPESSKRGIKNSSESKPGVLSLTPMTGSSVSQQYSEFLTERELSEITSYQEIYYIGDINAKITPNSEYEFDTPFQQYRVNPGDHLGYRYEVCELIGKGAFGQVFRCFDHKMKTLVAIKVLVNRPELKRQQNQELEFLKFLENEDANIIDYLDSFTFRNHLCIVTDLLCEDILTYIHKHKKITRKEVKSCAKDLLIALEHIHRHSVVHCDIKPENILLTEKRSFKLIDFGSACTEGARAYFYIQTRYYRAPEVILHLRYGRQIDIWSLGCVLCEILTGVPLFAGEDEVSMIGKMVELLGYPPLEMIQKSPCKSRYFTNDNRLIKQKVPFSVKLPSLLHVTDEALLDFIARCLEWDPAKRMSASEARRHKWITEK